MNDELFKAMAQSIIDGDPDEAARLANQAIAHGIDPMTAINQGFILGVSHVGDEFNKGNAFLPELVMAGDAMKAAVQVLEAEMAKTGAHRDYLGTVVIGTVEGDIHDIGKTLVGVMLSVAGFQVMDLGADVPMKLLLEKTRDVKPDIVALSALLTTTMTRQRDFIDALDDMGLRGSVKVMVGGAPVTRSWAQEIGADGFSEDAVGAVEVARSLIGQKG